jgi:hypothetical protein
VTGTALTGLTTSDKLTAINGWIITGTIPVSIMVTGDQLLNCIKYSEFAALTAQQQSNLLAVCHTPGQLLGGSGNTTLMVAGIFLACFTTSSATIANLTALAKASVTSWWAASAAAGGGALGSPVGYPDLAAAGGLA